MPNGKLKVALITSVQVKSWKFAVIQQLLSMDSVEICLVCVPDIPFPLKDGTNRMLSKVYEVLERLKYRSPRSSQESKSLQALNLNPLIIKKIKLEKFGNDYCFHKESSDLIKNESPDLIYMLDFIPLDIRGEKGNLTTFGCWFHVFGQHNSPWEENTGIREIIDKKPFLRSGLCAFQSYYGASEILYESKGPVNYFSLSQMREWCYWKSVHYVYRTINKLQAGKLAISNAPTGPVKILNRRVNSWSQFQLVIKFVWRYLVEKISNRFYLEKWVLLYSPDFQPFSKLTGFKFVIPSKNKFWADPFPYKDGDKNYLLIEESAMGKKKKGYLAAMEFDQNGKIKESRKILDHAFHISYPMVFDFRGKKYLVPESNQNKSILLYEGVKFPYEWKFIKSLKDNLYAVDTTFLFYNKLWWIFTNIKKHPQASLWDELHLFYTDNPLKGDWTPHPMNPIVSDVTKARCAGKIVIKGDQIFRPAQNCSYRYGYGLVIQEITSLTKDDYQESTFIEYNPEEISGCRGIHTINTVGNQAWADAILRKIRLF